VDADGHGGVIANQKQCAGGKHLCLEISRKPDDCECMRFLKIIEKDDSDRRTGDAKVKLAPVGQETVSKSAGQRRAGNRSLAGGNVDAEKRESVGQPLSHFLLEKKYFRND